MARRALVLVEATRNTLRYVQSAQRLGLHPIMLSADPGQYDYIAAKGIEAIRVDTDNLDALIRECSLLRTTYDIAGITSSAESFYATAGKLSRHFGLAGPNPASIERCCDKFIQRQLLAEAGVPGPAYRVAVNATEVERFAAEIGLPVILKPAFGMGSSGVRLCRNVDELAEYTTDLLGGKHVWLSSSKQRTWQASPRILVEEFAQGPQYNLEAMGNEVIGIAVADYGQPHFVCRGHIYPAPLTDEECARIADISLSCLRVLGLGWGPANIELRWTKRGPVVIEVNPRLAGSPVPEMVQLAYGVDLITEHIKLVIGKKCDLRRRHSHTVAARYLFADRDGTLDRIDGHNRAAALSGVAEVKSFAKTKTLIIRRGDAGDRIGHVIAASPSHARAEAILQQAVDLINWSITPFPDPW
ncbi:ATP-grasp domain-containing protein [Mesorhizobium sp. M6A.T.Ce.TU.002.03.1.1]|uniref:ATP-grasp domain-containing protein n=1 Tax=Mesorhizobium sp. M6A.T.Ce.TU.002.03.1.1 TaxID=2496782 RepID=UPI000FCA5663|nr:acetyl-CoA carboxylase biotin carboxylase subunit family protein [Mesorhizobium sp. M6A.T.Ce.TU.002.03.1.1]RUU33281.1 ATP-grasp domain-containing protein [Mesorhizobium sp. M6A.T.Ce.TU.002.03.1.1]